MPHILLDARLVPHFGPGKKQDMYVLFGTQNQALLATGSGKIRGTLEGYVCLMSDLLSTSETHLALPLNTDQGHAL